MYVHHCLKTIHKFTQIKCHFTLGNDKVTSRLKSSELIQKNQIKTNKSFTPGMRDVVKPSANATPMPRPNSAFRL